MLVCFYCKIPQKKEHNIREIFPIAPKSNDSADLIVSSRKLKKNTDFNWHGI